MLVEAPGRHEVDRPQECDVLAGVVAGRQWPITTHANAGKERRGIVLLAALVGVAASLA